MRRLLRSAAPGRLAGAALAGAGTVAAGMGLLATGAYLITRADLQPPILDLTVAIVGVRFFGISRAALRYLERLAAHDAALRMVASLRIRFFRAAARLTPGGSQRTGEVLAGATEDLSEIEQAVVRSAIPAIVTVLVTAAAAATTWALAPAAGPSVTAGLAVTAAAASFATLGTGRVYGRAIGPARGDLAAAVLDVVEGAPEAFVAGRSADLAARAERAADAVASITRRAAWYTGIGAAAAALGAGLTIWLTARAALAAATAGRLDPLLVGAVVLLALAAFEPVAALPGGLARARAAGAAARRLADLEAAPDPVPAGGRATPADATLRLRGAGVRSGEHGPWLLRRVDLDLHPGRRVAVVGPSGSGKTTLVDVLLRLRPLDEGRFEAGGADAGDLDPSSVQRLAALADEDAHLVDGTIADNLRIGRPGATDDEITGALEAVRLGGWVARLPLGTATRVGPRGAFVSGGERRRLALARALIADRPIVIVDEPAAGLDRATARDVIGTVVAAAAGRGLLMVTHDATGLESMDEILVLAAGRVVERGAFDDLRSAGGPFETWYAAGDHGERRRPGRDGG
jgi:thiol reductant ABC exporter CydC subunit